MDVAHREIVANSGVFEVPLFRPCSLYHRLEVPLDPLLALLALGPDQVELALLGTS